MRIVHLASCCSGGIKTHIESLMRLPDTEPVVVSLGSPVKALPLILSHKPDIVHCHGFKASWAGRTLLAPCHRKISLITTIHGMPGPRSGLISHRSAMRAAEYCLIPVTRAIITVSNHLTDVLSGSLSIPRHLIHTIPNGVDTSVFTPQGKLSSRPFTIGTVGRLAYEKGIDTLIMGAAKAMSDTDWKLRIAGDGPEMDSLQQLATDLNVNDRIDWMGTIPHADMPDFYRSLDLFCLCSRQEGQSISALEAMSSGLCVITSTAGALPEVIGDSGVSIEPDDPKQLAESIIGLRADSSQRAQLGGRARQRALEKFSLASMLKQTGKLYRGLSAGIVIMAALLLFTALLSPAHASTRAIVVIADGLTVDDLWTTRPGMTELRDRSAIGVISSGTRRDRTALWLTASSGRRVAATRITPRVYSAMDTTAWGESAMAVFQRRTGSPAEPDQSIIIDIPSDCRAEPMLCSLGIVSFRLRSTPVSLSAVGSSALPDRPHEPAAVIVATVDGLIQPDTFTVASTRDQRGPYGTVIDIDQVVNTIIQTPRPALVVIDYGDLFRLEQERATLSPEQYRATRLFLLDHLDDLILTVMSHTGNHDVLVLVSLTAIGTHLQLTPITISTPHIEPGQLLVSSTTRRPGLLAITDLLPTIMSSFALSPPPATIGVPALGIDGTVEDVTRDMYEQTKAVETLRTPVFQTYVTVFIILSILAALAVLFYRHTYTPRIAMLLFMAAPVAMHILPPLALPEYVTLTLLITITLTFATVITTRTTPFAAPLVLTIITAAIIILDQLAGGPLSVRSVLGYSVIAGARYYGIGNELGGVFLATTVLTGGLLMELRPRLKDTVVAASGIALSILIVGNPAVGANFGTAIGLVAAWSLFWLERTRKPLAMMIVAASGGLLIALLLSFYDSIRPVHLQSHLGRMVTAVQAGNTQHAIETGIGKIELNIRLIRYTVWSRVLLASLGTLFILSRRPLGSFARLLKQRPAYARALRAVMFGAAVSLITNDSGIVSAATASIYITSVTGYLLLLPNNTTV